jgi:hypothetical protein
VEASTHADGTNAVARRGRRRAVIATLAVGTVAVAVGIAAALSHAEVRRTNTNDVIVRGVVATLGADHTVCQDGERAAGGTTAIALTATPSRQTQTTLAVELRDSASGAPVAAGAAVARSAGLTAVPLRPRIARERPVRVCLRLRRPAAGAAVQLYGDSASRAASAMDGSQAIGALVHLDYLGGSTQSWWAFAPTVVRRIGYGHAWSGSSVALLAGLLTLTSIALAGWLLLRPS